MTPRKLSSISIMQTLLPAFLSKIYGTYVGKNGGSVLKFAENFSTDFLPKVGKNPSFI